MERNAEQGSDMRLPPPRPTTSATKVSSGRVITSAITRGKTSTSIGSSPMVLSALTSSRSLITPISAAKALPERPATMIAVISTPISRRSAMTVRSTGVDVGAELLQLDRALIGDHHADQDR